MSADTEMETSGRVAIGISFGNSYSSIAATIAEDPKVIANEEGDRQIPSIISYVEGEEFHGTQAKAQLVRNAKNTCAYFRDFLGKSFDSIDPTNCRGSAHPQAHESTTAFTIKDTTEEAPSTVTVSEITTRHLRRLKQSAADYLGKNVTAAVITVPTDFTDAQKSALAAAAKAADLEVLQFINEPVAALLAVDQRSVSKPSDRTVVVADLGGTRSDIAVISVRGGMYTILATTHDYELGGAKLDEMLMEHFAKEFVKKHKSDPRSTDRSLAKLRLEAEATKKALSLGNSAAFSAESLVDGIDFSSSINRSRYDLLCSKVFASFTRLIDTAVQKAELDILDIDEILLTGGTAHTPRIAQNLQSHFPSSTTVIAPATDSNAINPSELTARGAALQAFLIESFDQEDIDQSTHPMVTVTPHLKNAVGFAIKSADGSEEFQPIIQAETPIPLRRTVVVENTTEGEGIVLKICEGIRDIKITKPEPKAKTNGAAKADDDSDVDSDDEDEDEELREKVWKVGSTLGEVAIKDAKKGSKINVQITVGSELEVTISAMIVGSKAGVRGNIAGSGSAMNGSAH